MGKFSRLGHELYTGGKSYDFIGRRPLWYVISGGIVLAALLIVILRGFNFGVEFTGGTQYQLSGLTSSQATQGTVDELRQAIADSGVPGAEEPTVATSGDAGILIEVEELSQANADKLIDVIKGVVSVDDDQISPSEIGASWGKTVAKRAIIGVTVFILIAMFFIAVYFREWKMSVAAFVALFHDVIITMGVYSLSGFSVTPSAVTGLLAILGFSLYDTVVVFDKIRENTQAGTLRKSKLSYAEAANLAVNQTLVRSINTSIVALIPIGAILWVSAVQLGSSSLKDLALAQFVGMAAGVFSSVWVAPRILVHLKANEDEVKLAERRARARQRREADRYAAVPTYTETMPIHDAPEGIDLDAIEEGEIDFEGDDGPVVRRNTTASSFGSGRIAPPARGPVEESGASGRRQPTRKPRSQRGK